MYFSCIGFEKPQNKMLITLYSNEFNNNIVVICILLCINKWLILKAYNSLNLAQNQEGLVAFGRSFTKLLVLFLRLGCKLKNFIFVNITYNIIDLCTGARGQLYWYEIYIYN